MTISDLRSVLLVGGSLALAGCSTSGGESPGIGYGRYLQVVNEVGVVLETDSAVAGMLSCMETASSWLRQTPQLAGRIRCVGSPTLEPLPYRFKVQIVPERANEFYQTAPYEVKFLTSRLCRTMLSESLADKRYRLVEDKCGA